MFRTTKRVVLLLSAIVLSMQCSGLAAPRQTALNNRLIAAIKKGDAPAVRALLAKGANPNAHEQRTWKRIPRRKEPADFGGSKRRTGVKPPSALLIALGCRSTDDPHYYDGRRKSAAVIKALIEAGANVNEPEADQHFTPLLLAVIQDDVTETTRDLTTTERIAVVESLLRHGAKTNAGDSRDGTALMAAVMFPHQDKVVQLLLDHGADANSAVPDRGDRPLTLVRQASYIPMLVRYGADINAKDRHGKTIPARVKEEQGQFGGASDEVVEALRENGAHE